MRNHIDKNNGSVKESTNDKFQIWDFQLNKLAANYTGL